MSKPQNYGVKFEIKVILPGETSVYEVVVVLYNCSCTLLQFNAIHSTNAICFNPI